MKKINPVHILGIMAVAFSLLAIIPLFFPPYQSVFESLKYNFFRFIFFCTLFIAGVGLLALKNWSRILTIGLIILFTALNLWGLYDSIVVAPQEHPDTPKFFFYWHRDGFLLLFNLCLLGIADYLRRQKTKTYFCQKMK